MAERVRPFSRSTFRGLLITNLVFTDIRLGKGGDATVYAAEWHGTVCAAKRLHDALLDDESPGGVEILIAKFEEECLTWSKLRHPHVVQFLGVYLERPSRLPILIMEKMDTSLRTYLEDDSKEFSLHLKTFVLRQVSQALAYLHNQNPPLVHHDLSPNNILLNVISFVSKISDFGMSRAINPSVLTRKSSIKGTLAFMAPEALSDPPRYNEKLDVFSFGNVIISTLTRKWPTPGLPNRYEGDRIVALTELQRREHHIAMFTAQEKLLFLSPVHLCLENRPEKRPSSTILVQELKRIESSLSGGGHFATPIEQLRCQLSAKEEECRQKDDVIRMKDEALREKSRAMAEKLKDFEALRKKTRALTKIDECPVCCETYDKDEMVDMPHCQCSVCKECFCDHYTMMAQEKNIAHFNCLVCALPDFSVTDIDKDDYLTLFAALLKENVPSEQYQLFQKNATEFSLLKDPFFRWCAHTECGAGFIHDPPLNKVIQCPYCRYKMCFDCKRPWEDQHKGISCNDFTKWKAENDEGNQQKGLAAFLKKNGIECPKCHWRYDLARGGCLQFRCGQCPTDFCGGCGAVYDKACRKYKSCASKGFHAHHPRDCLFYLRDWPVESLQKLLTDKKVEFDTEAPEAQVNAARQAAGADQGGEAVGGAAEKEEPKASMAVGQLVLRCRVMLQKEIGTERVDEECGDDCKQGHGGLCEKHYKEYLIFKVNEAKLDPADNMEVDELKAVIMREEKAIPEGDEKDAQYKERLKEQLKKDLPLEHRGGLNF